MVVADARGSAAGRNRYLDLLRVAAIGAVVVGHWLLTSITYRGGQLSGLDDIRYISWAGWVTLAFQVMPVFFLVGGYVHAISWTGHHQRGEDWAGWVRGRAMGLLWPATVYLTVIVVAVAAARVAGAGTAELAQAGWLVALQLWFLPVYLLLIALTPVLLAAHRRWGLAVPAAMAAGAAAVDVAVVGFHVPVLGYANYLLVWGSMYQWGFAWRDGTLTRRRWRPYAMAAGGAAVLAGLVGWGPFPVDMIGAGERVGNTTPPSVALLAYAAAQTGLVLAAAPAVSRLLARRRWWRPVTRLNPAVMLVYLWHMVPVLIVAVAFYPTGVIPQPRIGSAQWWELRPAWIALLAVILVPLTAGLLWLHRPLLRVLPTGIGPGRRWSPAILLAGVSAAGFGLAKLAISGFAPGGRLPAPVLAAYACGLLLTLLSGSPSHKDGQITTDAVVPCPARLGTRESLVSARTAEPVTDGDDALDMPYRIDDGTAQLVGLRLTGDRDDAVADSHLDVIRPRQHDAGKHAMHNLVADISIRAAEYGQHIDPADDPQQPTGFVHHRQPLDPPVIHEAGGLLNGRIRADGDGGPGHQVTSGDACRLVVLPEVPQGGDQARAIGLNGLLDQQIPLGHHPDNPADIVNDGESADPAAAEHGRHLLERRVLPDGHH
jgi:fucose 4-O-acetylase-like acetyltransferase